MNRAPLKEIQSMHSQQLQNCDNVIAYAYHFIVIENKILPQISKLEINQKVKTITMNK
jgi:hypothetical protein